MPDSYRVACAPLEVMDTHGCREGYGRNQYLEGGPRPLDTTLCPQLRSAWPEDGEGSDDSQEGSRSTAISISA